MGSYSTLADKKSAKPASVPYPLTWTATNVPQFRFPLCIRGKGLLLDEKVLVQPFHLHGAGDPNTHAMLDHQVGEAVTVDENNALGQVADEVDGRGGEAGRGDEDAFGGTDADEAAEKALHFWPADADMGGVALGLHIDAIKAEAVLIDHAIDTTVPGFAQPARGIFMAATVTHANEQIDDGALEEGRALRQNALQQVRLQG